MKSLNTCTDCMKLWSMQEECELSYRWNIPGTSYVSIGVNLLELTRVNCFILEITALLIKINVTNVNKRQKQIESNYIIFAQKQYRWFPRTRHINNGRNNGERDITSIKHKWCPFNINVIVFRELAKDLQNCKRPCKCLFYMSLMKDENIGKNHWKSGILMKYSYMGKCEVKSL